jgi:hypothetical protein
MSYALHAFTMAWNSSSQSRGGHEPTLSITRSTAANAGGAAIKPRRMGASLSTAHAAKGIAPSKKKRAKTLDLFKAAS